MRVAIAIVCLILGIVSPMMKDIQPSTAQPLALIFTCLALALGASPALGLGVSRIAAWIARAVVAAAIIHITILAPSLVSVEVPDGKPAAPAPPQR